MSVHPLELMFWSRVEWSEGCWMWTGPRSAGYGDWGGTGAHRIAYLLAVGPIPDGHVIDHLCATKLCVNPVHLEPVTIRENILRFHGLGRTRRAGRDPKPMQQRVPWGRRLACEQCGAPVGIVIDTRHLADGIRRRRECRNGHRVTTYEKVA